MSILDICVSTSDTWSTLNSNGPADSSRRSSFSGRQRRGTAKRATLRRRRKQDQSSSSSASSSDSDDEEEEGTTTLGGGYATTSFVSFVDEGFTMRIERMDKDLDELVGFVRRGVEGLARSAVSVEVREVYGTLSWKLAGWR